MLCELASDNIDFLLECGFNKPPSTLKLRDKVTLIQTVTLHKVIMVSIAELSEFKKGLESILLNVLNEYGALLHYFYCKDVDEKLTAGRTLLLFLFSIYFIDTIRKMFSTIKFSEVGSNSRVSEETAYAYFIDYLEDCEKGIMSSFKVII